MMMSRFEVGLYPHPFPPSAINSCFTLGTEDLKPSLWKGFLHSAEQLDLLGLVLLGSSIAFILLTLTLASKTKGGWSNRTFY